MVVFDSEYVCRRCGRRIKKGNEVWILQEPYGPECARILRANDNQLPEASAKGVDIDIDFEAFRTSGVSELGDGESA